MLNGGVEDGQDDEEREVKEAVMAALEAKGVLSQVGSARATTLCSFVFFRRVFLRLTCALHSRTCYYSQVRATLRAAVFTAVDAQERAHGIHVPNEKALSLQNTHQGE